MKPEQLSENMQMEAVEGGQQARPGNDARRKDFPAVGARRQRLGATVAAVLAGTIGVMGIRINFAKTAEASAASPVSCPAGSVAVCVSASGYATTQAAKPATKPPTAGQADWSKWQDDLYSLAWCGPACKKAVDKYWEVEKAKAEDAKPASKGDVKEVKTIADAAADSAKKAVITADSANTSAKEAKATADAAATDAKEAKATAKKAGDEIDQLQVGKKPSGRATFSAGPTVFFSPYRQPAAGIRVGGIYRSEGFENPGITVGIDATYLEQNMPVGPYADGRLAAASFTKKTVGVDVFPGFAFPFGSKSCVFDIGLGPGITVSSQQAGLIAMGDDGALYTAAGANTFDLTLGAKASAACVLYKGLIVGIDAGGRLGTIPSKGLQQANGVEPKRDIFAIFGASFGWTF